MRGRGERCASAPGRRPRGKGRAAVVDEARAVQLRLPPRPVSQGGNALLMALLALVLSSITAAALFQQKERDRKAAAGHTEASVLDTLRAAANTAMLDGMLAIQAGQPVSKASPSQAGRVISIEPVGEGSERVWRATPAQLADMGYLPSGWVQASSPLNNARYDIVWRRTPGCASSTCDIEGSVVLMGPIRDPGDPVGTSDAAVIGPILTHFGVDAGVSLFGSPALITGFGGPWSLPNPVPGAPPGVVAVRFGSASSLMSRFVRIGDTRDPQLAGELSVRGRAMLNGGATIQGGDLQVQDADGRPCIRLQPSGEVTLGCNGSLTATQARFASNEGGTGDTTTVSGSELKTTGRVSAANVSADDSLSGQRLVLPDVAEGALCSPTTGSASLAVSQYAGLQGGGLAFCANGRWLPISRFRTAGNACPATEEGAQATDLSDRQGLICRNGSYWRSAALLSNFVLVQTLDILITTAPVTVPKPACPAAGNGTPASPLIILTANSEDAPIQTSAGGSGAQGATVLAGVNRFAEDNGQTWVVHLERSSDRQALAGLLIASIYCFYR